MWDKSASSVGKSLHTGSKFMDFSIFSTKVCEKVQSCFFLNPKFQAFSYLLWLNSPVCVRPGRKPGRHSFDVAFIICGQKCMPY